MLMITLRINDNENSVIPAIVDTGANCSCVNTDFRDKYFPGTKLELLRTRTVNQASGGSIGAIGMIDIICNIKNKMFKHKFIVCSTLKTSMILGLDFAQTYRIGIDWDDNMDPYLRSEGKYLVSAMPLELLSPEVMINMVQNDIPQCSPKSTPSPRKSSVSCKLRPMVRLMTRTQVRILPNTFAVVPVKQARPPGMGGVKNLDVMGYESFYMEYPGISVVPTTHIKINRNKAGYLTLLMCNNTSEEVVIQKSNTVALGIKSQWKVRSKSNQKWGHTRKLVINKLTSTHQEEAPTTTSVQKTLEDTAFVG